MLYFCKSDASATTILSHYTESIQELYKQELYKQDNFLSWTSIYNGNYDQKICFVAWQSKCYIFIRII